MGQVIAVGLDEGIVVDFHQICERQIDFGKALRKFYLHCFPPSPNLSTTPQQPRALFQQHIAPHFRLALCGFEPSQLWVTQS